MSLLTVLLASGYVGSDVMSRPPISSFFAPAKVPDMNLAVLFFVGAVLGLRDESDVAMNVYVKKGILGSTAAAIAVTPWQPGQRRGLEGWIISRMVSGQSVDAEELVKSWYARDVYHPERILVDFATELLVASGHLAYLTEDAHRGKLGGLVLGQTKRVLVAVPELIAGLTDDLELAARRWLSFRWKEPDLCLPLFQQCNHGISARQVKADISSSGGFD
jgi:hypothetical protein